MMCEAQEISGAHEPQAKIASRDENKMLKSRMRGNTGRVDSGLLVTKTSRKKKSY